MQIGEKIKERRKELHLSQTELAELVGLTTATAISSWEKGRNEPSLDTVVLLSEVLHVSVEYLLDIPESGYTGEEKNLIQRYRMLDEGRAEILNGVLNTLVKQVSKKTETHETEEVLFLKTKDALFSECKNQITELKELKKETHMDVAFITQLLWYEGYNGKISIADVALIFANIKVPNQKLINDMKSVLMKGKQ